MPTHRRSRVLSRAAGRAVPPTLPVVGGTAAARGTAGHGARAGRAGLEVAGSRLDQASSWAALVEGLQSGGGAAAVAGGGGLGVVGAALPVVLPVTAEVLAGLRAMLRVEATPGTKR